MPNPTSTLIDPPITHADIRRFAEEGLQVKLAISLHAATDEARTPLLPVNRRWPIDELMAACADYVQARGRRLSFEWALIDGVNDRASDAAELAELCRQLQPAAHVNLIPLNPTPGSIWTASERAVQNEFVRRLNDAGIPTTLRDTRGKEIDGACGQLAAADA